MPKQLSCGDLISGCKAVIEGKDEAEVMGKVRSAIKEKGSSQRA
jgi:predicted small metal-binding protein